MATTVKVACEAMATRFEFVLNGDNPMSLRALGEEALEEIRWVESQLSIYRSDSQINRVNQKASREPVRVEPTVFRLLEQCRNWTLQTGGAFDITLGPLSRCWGFVDGAGRLPDSETVKQARQLVGMHRVLLDSDKFSVRFEREGMMLDFGSVGKGFALERAREILRENGIESALLHGGTSTVATIGTPLDQEAWKIAIPEPGYDSREPGATRQFLGIAFLKGESLSVSAGRGKSFRAGSREYGHVLDREDAGPVEGGIMGVIQLPDACAADALSTALLASGKTGRSWLKRYYPESLFLYCDSKPDGSVGIENEGFSVGKESGFAGQTFTPGQ